jgi:branched-chain amino acid transport system substrate-binding protein
MYGRKLVLAAVGVVFAAAAVMPTVSFAEDEITYPSLVYRTGPYAPNGVPFANGGVNGIKINLIECETGYKTDVGVECYEKLKGEGAAGAALFNPLSTGITYQLIEKSWVDKVPILSMGYGRTSAADGRVFKWTFNFPTTYWSQASALI